ncbi:jumonji/arid domain-containing protein, putative [Ixodes scapularis]|uniref:Jumonji/arid domain-containing protein, putative n=1 Tax=Ixodes scapularis TaxID=6945 RepID=B7PWB5_IXOSC|nr:jumonji/arid domain-containing protein, putative [Ixodes scapularis]|eukprot:XP_002409657.1 jumonji/arid domain-containing protein, putative [Ixodes scapularis]
MIPTIREVREPVGPPSTLLPCKRRPKTEDFLTFLCLRGTSALPPSLDFMGGAGCSGTSSERSSSPDGDSRLAPPACDTRESSKGANGSLTMSSSTDTRAKVQMLPPAKKQQSKSAQIAKKLLSTAKGHVAPRKVGLNLIKREEVPSKATVGTNTSDVDLLSDSFASLNSSDDYALPEETSVSTQTESSHSLNCRRNISVFRKPSAKSEPPVPSTLAPKGKGSSRKARGPLEDLKKVKLTPLHSKKFPGERDAACLVVAPTYRPTAEEIKDPIGYISKIRAEAEKFGICRIILPSSFQPECKVFDEMRFTAHNQFIHQMFSRWGPNVKHTACIKRCFMKQGITDDQPPLIGGIEVDLSHLYHTVQSFGGIQQVMEKKKWQRVADAMHIPRAAQDRVSKVDDAYCKFVLPYDLLSPEEKANVEKEVEADHEQQLAAENDASAASAEEELEEEFGNECVTKENNLWFTDAINCTACLQQGRTMSLSVFQRVARNTMSMWYKQDPSDEDVEKDYWGMVIDQKRHVCVHAGNIDSSVHGSGFPTNRVIPFAKHPWNLKVFTNNPGTVLRCMGPVSGVTIPTLHLSMLFTTGCWYRDPHCLPWIEYLHTGANKIWYSVPAQSSQRFHSAMKDIMPQVCKDSVIWLPSDCAMVPPALLVENGCPLSRTVQEKGQFVVIFPGAFTSTIACGYSVSESVYFATKDWLLTASQCFQVTFPSAL